MAGITGAALLTQPYNVQRKYWNDITRGITEGKSGNATYDANTPPDQQQWHSKVALFNMIKQYGTGPMTHSVAGAGGNRIPGDILALAKKEGMVNADGSVNTKYDPGPDPFVARQRMLSGRDPVTGKLLPHMTYDPTTGGWSTGAGSSVPTGGGRVA